MKGFVLVLIFGLCSLIGVHAAGQLKQRRRILQALKLEMEEAGNLLLNRGLSPEEAGKRMGEKSLWFRTAKLLGQEESFREAWRRAFMELQREERSLALLTEAERSLLLDFGDRMGSCRREEELKKLVSYLCGELDRILGRLEAELPQKSRLYRSMGLCTGAALVLFIW